MSRFSEFIKDDKNAEVKNTRKFEEDISKLIDKYSQLSSDELMSEFIKEGERKKNCGELNDGELSRIKSILSPYLNQEQTDKLNNLLDKVK